LTAARIVIVEDDMLIAMDLQATLEDLGHHVVSVVPTGEEGIREVEEADVDLLLMDIRLAGQLDGIATAKLIQSRFDIPIIFVTAATPPELTRLDCSTGFWDYVAKPFCDEELRTAIDMAIEKRGRPLL
jgi:CheY-like chemotaxis protein